MLRSQNEERSPILWKIEKHFKLKKLIEWKYERTENDASNFHRQVSILEKVQEMCYLIQMLKRIITHVRRVAVAAFSFAGILYNYLFFSCMEIIYCT